MRYNKYIAIYITSSIRQVIILLLNYVMLYNTFTKLNTSVNSYLAYHNKHNYVGIFYRKICIENNIKYDQIQAINR